MLKPTLKSIKNTMLKQDQKYYRSDVDGLRGLAVLGVILYHAEVKWLSGGYMGVDVFFVISGYVISAIMLRNVSQGNFSLVDFYKRRIKRIAPALIAMLIFSMVCAWFIMLPWELAQFGKSLRYVIITWANIYFYKNTGGYFQNEAEEMPLLHTWSLAIEEQFYMVFPLLFILATRFRWSIKIIALVMASIGLASFILCVLQTLTESNKAFYLLPYRAWEFTLGAGLAMIHLIARDRWFDFGKSPKALVLSQIAGAIGLGLICWSWIGFTVEMAFPGYVALIPCLGTVFVIASGIHESSLCRRILSWRPLVFIGLISYSLYLWHWPLLVFHEYLIVNDSHHLFARLSKMSILLISLVFATVSWRWVEAPFRRGKQGNSIVFGAWLAISILFLVFAITSEKSNGFIQRFSPQVQNFANASNDRNPFNSQSLRRRSADQPFLYGDTSKGTLLAIWGDSHASAISPLLDSLAKQHGFGIEFHGVSNCPPLAGVFMEKGKGSYSNNVFHRIKNSREIKAVVLCSRWISAIRNSTHAYGVEERMNPKLPLLRDDNGLKYESEAALDEVFREALVNTVTQLIDSGKIVFVVYPVPETGYHIPHTLAKEVIRGRNPSLFRVSAQRIFYERQAPVMKVLDSIPDHPNLYRIKPHEKIIQNNFITVLDGDDIMYFDDDHLSITGAKKLESLFTPVVESLYQKKKER